MKLSASTLFPSALLLGWLDGSFFVSGRQSEFETEPIARKMGRWEVARVGSDGSGNGDDGALPYAIVDTLEPLTGEVYFEVNKDNFEDTDPIIYVEVFARVSEGAPCHTGYLVEGSHRFTITTGFEPYDDYAYPKYSNGRVGRAMYTISPSPFDMGERQRIFFEKDEFRPQRQLLYCVRVSTKVDFMGDSELDPVGYIDTFMKVNVQMVGTFSSTLSTDVEVDSSDSSNAQTSILAHIPLASYLCDSERNPILEGTKYIMGQVFRVCVTPAENLSDNRRSLQEGDIEYSVVGFDSIHCSNNGVYRELVEKELPGTRTTVDPVPDAIGSLSFASVVDSEFFVEGESSFWCDGRVKIRYNGDTIGMRSRFLREDGDEYGTFDLELEIDQDPLGSPPASRPLTLWEMVLGN